MSLSTHKLFCFRQGVPSPISDLTQRLLLEDRDPPATPLESSYEAPPFDEVDIQALAHAVELTRQGAIDSLRFAKGDLYQAFQNELCRIRLDDPMFDELVHEYCVYRGFVNFSVVDSPGMQLSINDDQSESGQLSKNCSTEVGDGNTKLSGSDTSASQVIMEGSPESTNLASIQSTDTEERYPSETSYGDCSTSGTPQFEKVLQKNKCLRVGETNKRKRWRGRHENTEFVSGPTSERSREDLNADTTMLKDQQACILVSPKSCFLNMMKNREDKHELVLGLKELASRGMTEEVVEEINEMDSNFFVQNPSLLFQLKQVEFLKLVGSGDHTQALRVACSFLGPLASSHPDLLKPLKETLLALLKPNEEAFNDRLPLCVLANSLQDNKEELDLFSFPAFHFSFLSIDSLGGHLLQFKESCQINLEKSKRKVAIGRRLGIEEPQLMKIIRATLYTHSEWFKLQMCKDRFEGLLRIDALKEVGAKLIIDASRLDVDMSTDGSSQVTGSSNNRKQEDGSPTQSSARDVGCDETAILKVMEFLALPRADAIHLLAQHVATAVLPDLDDFPKPDPKYAETIHAVVRVTSGKDFAAKERKAGRVHLEAGSDAPRNVTFKRAPSSALLKVGVPLIFRGSGLKKGLRSDVLKLSLSYVTLASVLYPKV
uniref:CTLH domain-containing protein n=1 Tax=Solanum lycopersicum TaxID=4081 RepID=A0A3Q7FA49_SOLLC